MAETNPASPDPVLARALARKIRLSKLALVFERLWPRVWLMIGLALIFIGFSLADVWSRLGTPWHQIALAAFAIAALAGLVHAVRIPWPTREEALRRIERRSSVPHRPASSYEDTLSSGAQNNETAALWQAHRERLKRAIARLRVGRPSPRADRFDPYAVRALGVLGLVALALLSSGSLTDRLASAFRFGAGAQADATRVDAWVTPPPYTALPPVMLADGAVPAAVAKDKDPLHQVPERSLLTLRGIGFGKGGVELEVLSTGASEPERIVAEPAKNNEPMAVSEVRYEIKKSARIRALAGSRELGRWTFDVIPDQLPKISLTALPSGTPRGSMRIDYKGEDDYGIQSAEAKVRPAKPKPGDPAKSWAKPKPLSGPRLPLERPPELTLKIPRAGAKTLESSTLLEIAEHPWAGQRVEFWLEATDVGGQIGRSQPIEIVLPARRFKNPLARALIEQRRKLVEDSRNRPMVARALDALAFEPEGFIEQTGVYLGLRTVFRRLEREGDRATIKESVDHLWHLALLIEDGALSDAERALKDVQDRLAEALRKGADDKDIQDLMAELKQKLNDYLNEMQKNADKQNPQGDQQQSDESDQLGQQDLEQMMNDLERNAREGSREEAERMLSELRELMDRLQAGNSPEAKAERERAEQMMKKLNQLSDLTSRQQQLMDETFGEQRQQGEQAEGGSEQDQSGQQSPNARQGQQQGQQQGQRGAQAGQEGGGQQGQGQQGRDGQGAGERRRGQSDLEERQAGLRQELERLKRELNEMGAGDPDKLGNAEEAMGRAEQALKEKNFEEAAEQQGQALEQMRQSAQQMAEQMQKNAQQRIGRGGNSPRDPLGRPQRSEGPDLGNSVKVPDAIDAQRAREILDELRRRSGENLRPPAELDYIDRLLKRF